jgi:protein-disulfide isomerase
MYLQFASLRAFCPLCTVSALIVGGLVWAMSKAAHFTAAEDWTASQSTALTLAAFAVFPVSILLISGLTSQSSSGPRRLQIDLSEAHLSGPADARVKLVVFSDFQCPFCRDLAPILNQVRNQFPHEVALGFHHFPIESHRRAFPAALAAECAAEQGKFWEYHDKLFAEGGDLSDSKLLALADSLSLDQKRFAECLKSEKPKQRVEASRRDAANSGLEGVPAVFLNGLRVEGPLDYENLVRKINELLLAMPPIRAGENSP